MNVLSIVWTFVLIGLASASNKQDETKQSANMTKSELIYASSADIDLQLAATKSEYLDVHVDHFSFTTSDKFKLRYLINSQKWKRGRPIFFYTGNQADIWLFARNTGFIWEVASELEAMVVYAEHRFYGKSLPFGANSLKNRQHFGYLTSEQALADYVDVITHIKATYKGASSSPVIAFGGSYGGMLSAWLRQKYPYLVAGAIASSAPVLMFSGVEPLGCDGFNMVMTHTFSELGSSYCPKNVQATWKHFFSTSLKDLTKIFRLCHPLKDRNVLVEWITDALIKMTMANYPYPTNFVANLPAWPVKVFCNRLTEFSKEPPLRILSGGMEIYYNYSGKAKCLDLRKSMFSHFDDVTWEYQKCMEMVMPMCSTGKIDMFIPSKWNLDEYSAQCRKQLGVEPRPDWIVKEFWGNRLVDTASNILFSNGDLDPWAAGGLTKSLDPNRLPVILIRQGAHQLDLRGSNRLDPPSVKAARIKLKTWIKRWIKAWRS